MRIVLRKVTKTPLDFEVTSNEMTFKGFLEYYSAKLILLKASISGTLEKSCDICAQGFNLKVSEEVEFFINDGIYEDDSSTLLDVVESLDGNVDLEEILHSEIELIKSDYHSCGNCSKPEEIEF
ncbi:hypothetical protein [Sulfurimonas sp. NW9]|uniref:hypothetical protein n=1 Tax=Sulfurimonas sp. NW9 TaxID=2922728 RepID=UPI003DA96D57